MSTSRALGRENALGHSAKRQKTWSSTVGAGSRRPFREITNLLARAPPPLNHEMARRRSRPMIEHARPTASHALELEMVDATLAAGLVDTVSDEDELMADVEVSQATNELVLQDPLLRLEETTEVGTIAEEESAIASQICARLREKQMISYVLRNYLDEQPLINAKMRGILVDWLIEVHYRFKLETQTLFLTINYLDRYLAKCTTPRHELQLVGVTAMFIAAKFEEIEAIEVADLVYVTDSTFTAQAIIDVERQMLHVLQFRLAIPTTQCFLGHMAHALRFDPAVSHLAAYFSQQTLLHLHLITSYAPSVLASGCIFLAQCSAQDAHPREEWALQWTKVAGTTMHEVADCLRDLCIMIAAPSRKFMALRQKFGTKRFSRVAKRSFDALAVFVPST